MKKNKKPLENLPRPFVFLTSDLLKPFHEELQYFFQQSDAACEISSNYQAFLFAMVNSCSISSAEEQLLDCLDKRRSEEDKLKSIGKNRTINNKFVQLSAYDQRVLSYFFYEQQFDRSLEAHFGQGIKLIPLTKSFKKLPVQWQNLNKLQFVLIHERKLIDKIKKEVSEIYLTVLEKYAKII